MGTLSVSTQYDHTANNDPSHQVPGLQRVHAPNLYHIINKCWWFLDQFWVDWFWGRCFSLSSLKYLFNYLLLTCTTLMFDFGKFFFLCFSSTSDRNCMNWWFKMFTFKVCPLILLLQFSRKPADLLKKNQIITFIKWLIYWLFICSKLNPQS